MTAVVEGPAWALPGLDQRPGRYSLAVEAPVLAMTATLMPGLSTQTQYARYYGLYWALAERAERGGLDAAACRRTIRRAELLLAHVTDHVNGRELVAHGADGMLRGREKQRPFWALAEEGKESYSVRAWGFWGQYGGPSEALGTVTTDGRALRASRHPCPPDVVAYFAPLFDLAAGTADPDPASLLALLEPYELGAFETPDLVALGELFTASRHGRHDPDDWTSADHTRRAGLRILARAGTLRPESSWSGAMREVVAYGDAAATDAVLLADADRVAAWRGLLLRHSSVGAWRKLWAGLVGAVADHDDGIADREDLHAWVADQLPDRRVADVEAGLPPVVDAAGHPFDAESVITAQDDLTAVHRDITILMLGARRRGTLDGPARAAFLGGRRTFLDPSWVAHQVADHAGRSLRDLGRALVDDMLAQSRRVALRKMTQAGGRLTVFSRLHERNGTYTATSREGDTNVGLRVEELAHLGYQLGLLGGVDEPVTALGGTSLGVPR